MFSKLDEVETRFEEINLLLQDPSVATNQDRYKKLMQEFAEQEAVVKDYRKYKKLKSDLEASKEILRTESDSDIRDMAKQEINELEQEIVASEQHLKLMLLPKDPNDEKNIIIEVRAGAGGDEASLFAEQLFRAYTVYAANQGWRTRVLSISEGNVGGVKEVIASISGEKVFSKLKYESGVHRVQRVPKTETQGRLHTSTVTVAVIPEAEEVDVKIHDNDIRVDVFRSGGHGGQSVNTTDSAVRVTHIPSGLVVICQDGKSQLSNKQQALKVLASRLLALEEEKARKEASDARLSQIGTGDRSERIRTYNFPQSRITDHRVGLTLHSLPEVMNGKMEDIIEPVAAYFQSEALKQQTK